MFDNELIFRLDLSEFNYSNYELIENDMKALKNRRTVTIKKRRW
jgi:hypothetical protein